MSEAHAPVEADAGMMDKVGDWGRTPRASHCRVRWMLYGEREEPTPGCAELYEPPGDHVGVCCSGGGIRSAAFNLGALQVVLADRDFRARIKYLSAVSGGAYIASAFCMVAKTWGREPNDVDSDPALVTDAQLPFHPGSPEEQYLRNHLGYLAPDNMAKVYLFLRMLAALVVNVLLIGLPVLILGLVFGLAADTPYDHLQDGTFHLPRGALIAVVAIAALSLLLAGADVLWRAGTDRRRTALRTWEVRMFLLASGLFVLLIAVPWLAAQAASLGGTASAGEGIWRAIGTAASSIGALALSAFAHVRGRVRDEQKTIANAQTKLGKFAKGVREAVVAIVVTLVGPLLLLTVGVLGVLIAADGSAAGVVVLVAAAALLAVMWIGVDLTSVSLHPFYRRRLSSAFALRRVGPVEHPLAEERPYDELVALSQTRVLPEDALSSWPALIVCASANVSDPGVTPPGRPVASFTFSPTAIGGPLTGATRTEVYEQLSRNRRRDVTLPAAVAMSGAALSPSMGKQTYRPLSFLLALANIRLGVWVANPRHVNDEYANPEQPGVKSLAPRGRKKTSLWHRPRPEYLWKELFGRNRLDDRFLYVTDGGHYENLGLVELLRRGCGTILCFDAGGGKASAALGDAIALARSELNIEIVMDKSTKKLEETKEPPLRSKADYAVGTITYPGVAQPGKLIYIRSVVTETAPWDLANYQEDGVFPHHSTFDQFFDDQKFEAYRRLGTYAATSAMGRVRPKVAQTNGAAQTV